jgi:chromosome segregation ATPase
LEALVEEYRRKNTELQKELESTQASESECQQKLQAVQQRHRKEMMQLETSLLDREAQLRETYEVDIQQLEHCLLDCQQRLEQHVKSAQEVELARDQLDMFQHTQERLAEAEEKLRKYRERWEQAADLQTALTREQEAHTLAVEQCLRLEEQLQDLQPLSRQLEEYKSKWTVAQVEMAQLQANLEKLQTEHVMWNQTKVQMSQSVQAYQEQSDQLLQQLQRNVSEEGIEVTANGSVIGEGIR